MQIRRKFHRKTKIILTWLRQRISPYCFGVKTRAGNPAHVNKNDDVLYHFQCLKTGWHRRRLSRLKNIDLTDHFDGKKTYYFTADGRSSVPEVLVNIDIDCHGSGSLAGAIAFAEHLKATAFPNLYFETSTNGNGVHGYVVVIKGDLGDEGLNSALYILDRWLKHELSKGSWDVENVEVKGQSPEFTWGMKKFELKTYKSGQLAKLPREVLKRADELLGTTRIMVEELRRLKVPTATKAESEDSVASKDERAGGSVVSGKKERKQAGSIAGRHFGEDELAKLKGGYLSLARDRLGEKKLVAKGRKVVTVEDLAVFLMLLRFFTENMNVDGSLPTARWRDMWLALYSCGDIERGWCHHRYARMRNFLDEEGLLSWEDEDFVVGVFNDSGEFVPGEAAKWKAGEELMMELQEVEQAAVVVDGEKEEEKSILYGCNQQDHGLLVEKGEEKSILYGCNDQAHGLLVEKEEEKSILYGHTSLQTPNSTRKPRQSESFRSQLDSLGIWIPLTKPRFVGYSWPPLRMAA